MKQMTFADPGDWCTLAYAAETIGVSLRTVARAIADGKLSARRPRVGSRETNRRHVMLYVSEVEEFAAAYKRVNRDA